MDNFEFIKFEPTPDHKYLGIVTAKAYGKIILRFKVVAKKEGGGYFPTAPAIRQGDEANPVYLSAFLVDSRSEEEELLQVIRSGIKPYLSGDQKDPSIESPCPF